MSLNLQLKRRKHECKCSFQVGSTTLAFEYVFQERGIGYRDFMTRDAAINSLPDGTLTVTLELQIMVQAVQPLHFPIQNAQFGKLRHAIEVTDVKFECVGGECFAHAPVLWAEAPFLYSLSMEADVAGESRCIYLDAIKKAEPDDILDFVYLRKIPELSDTDNMQQMLTLADRFEIVMI